MANVDQPGGPNNTTGIDHRVAELLTFVGGHTASMDTNLLSMTDRDALAEWTSLTTSLVHSKFDGLVSDTFDGISFAGLNESVTSRYLSDDPLYAFGMPNIDDYAQFGRFGYRPESGLYSSYPLFDFAEFESLQLYDEMVEDMDFRNAVSASRRRASLFAPRQKPGGMARFAAPSISRDVIAHEEWADPTDPTEIMDTAMVNPYPRAMGSTGARRLTPSQKRLARMTRKARANPTKVANQLTHNARTTGPSIQGRHALIQSFNPVWSPDTTATADSFGATHEELLSPEFLADTTDAIGAIGPKHSTIQLGDLSISEQGVPALAKAVKLAKRVLAPRFLPASRRQKIGPKTTAGAIQGGAKTPFSPRLAQQNERRASRLAFDAAEQTWLTIAPTAYEDGQRFHTPYNDIVPTAPRSPEESHAQGSFVGDLGQGASTATATRPELFAAQQIARTQSDAHSPGPVTRAGEVRYDQWGTGQPVADPVVYVSVPDTAGMNQSVDGGAWDISVTTPKIAHMSPAISAAMHSVTMPLSSVSRLDEMLRTTTPSAQAIGITPSFESAPFEAGETSPLLVESHGTSPEQSLYTFAYDAESVFLKGELFHSEPARSLAGTHVEVRGQSLFQSVPSSAQAAQTNAVRPLATTANNATTAANTLLQAKSAGSPMSKHIHQLRSQGIQTGSVTPQLHDSGKQQTGVPTIGLPNTDMAFRTRLQGPMATAGIQASIAEADLAMLPPVIRELLSRHSERGVAMTQGGTDVAGLLARVEAFQSVDSPGTRSALMNQLVLHGVDTPELLRVLDDIARPASSEKSTSATTPSAQTKRSLFERAAASLDRLGVTTAQSTTFQEDQHFGSFAPARLQRTGLEDRLKSLLSPRGSTASRTSPSSAALMAETGTHLSLTADATTSTATLSDPVRRSSPALQQMSIGAPAAMKAVMAMDAATPGLPPALRSFLKTLPSNRPVTQFVGQGFDFIYSVLDRANGAFAGLDAGVLESLIQLGNQSPGTQDGQLLRPGVDPWASPDVEYVSPEGGSGSGAGRSDSIEQLKKRADAAETAYARLRTQASDAGRSPTSFDGVDWSLVKTGSERSTAGMAFGELGSALLGSTSTPSADMTMVAPVVKAVAQTAQLKETSEPVGGGGSSSRASEAEAPSGGKSGKVNYPALAKKVLPYVVRNLDKGKLRGGFHS